MAQCPDWLPQLRTTLDMVWLLEPCEGGAGELRHFWAGTFTVGRKDADILMTDRAVSRKHAVLEVGSLPREQLGDVHAVPSLHITSPWEPLSPLPFLSSVCWKLPQIHLMLRGAMVVKSCFSCLILRAGHGQFGTLCQPASGENPAELHKGIPTELRSCDELKFGWSQNHNLKSPTHRFGIRQVTLLLRLLPETEQAVMLSTEWF